ncbi:hypothetical protein M8818_007494 [Zalaria obscura]|uniref:Uncharacterized protein n=1 Tax=Zalaria obscura TaxID=2024903 RepID=A0ACC3S558_9PEZI
MEGAKHTPLISSKVRVPAYGLGMLSANAHAAFRGVLHANGRLKAHVSATVDPIRKLAARHDEAVGAHLY